MKKRYNKLVAYLLTDFSTVGVVGVLIGLVALIMEACTGEKENIVGGGYILLLGVVSSFLTFLLTLYINSRTPKGERVGTWFRAWWLGFKIAWKIALCFTLILIPVMLKWSIEYAEKDSIDSTQDTNPNWYDRRKYVYDDNGNKYEVGRSGEYVKDKKGNWQKVNRDDMNNPYLGNDGWIDNDKTELR